MDAMTQLGNGLSAAERHADALVVKEAELSVNRRLGAPETQIYVVQNNLANTYDKLERREEALRIRRDVYSGRYTILGKEHGETLLAANNYASSLVRTDRFEEARSLMRKMMPVARRVAGDHNENTLQLRANYAIALYTNDGATLDDLREAVTTLEDAERTARRVLGGGQPTAVGMEQSLRQARAVLSAREGDLEPLRAAVEAMAPGDA